MIRSSLLTGAVFFLVVSACGSQQLEPAATVSATPETPDAPPTAAPSANAEPPPSEAAPRAASAGLTFESSTFGDSAGPSKVTSLASFGSGLIAVGVSYEQALPVPLGPMPPHIGRIWASADGRSWEDVTPRDLLANAALKDVIQRADGTLLAVGEVAVANEYGDLVVQRTGAWESSDGVTWELADTGLPADRWVRDFVQGDKGIVAVAWLVGDTHGSEIWFSADGRAWQRIRHLAHGYLSIDAGIEGFVAVGTWDQYVQPAGAFAIASADGREWFDAAGPPQFPTGVAAVGGDWVTVSSNEDVEEGWITISSSANGLDWSSPIPVEADEVRRRIDDVSGCWLVPSLISANDWMILRTFRGGLCGEGNAMSFGPHLIRTDEGGWEALPIVNGDEDGRGQGSWVAAAEVVDEGLVLAGESNGQATFWWAGE